MRFASADEALRAALAAGGAGPIAILLCEDGLLAADSAAHLLGLGAAAILTLGPEAPAEGPSLFAAPATLHDAAARAALLTRIIRAAAGRWLLIAFNGEFPYHPFAETRPLPALIEFLGTERRRAAMGCAIDLYDDGMIGGGAPNLAAACFDADGWYGFEREGRLADVRGGLGWRFEDHAPPALARVNRPVLFRAEEGLEIGPDLWLSDPEMNAASCPWHLSPTLAVMSYRRTRRLLAHPAMRGLATLTWPKTARFEWRAGQLVRLGMIEEGQWF
ncbi:MAG: hypothetical protein ACE37J_20170 [Pikeienuella sp.]|uniref:hypothetical protein n=1 Tax=Pikeienuella sp. TaxID=2831957 RepID=UPI00391939F2